MVEVRMQVTHPDGIALLQDGTLLVADSGNHCIRRIYLDGETVTFAGQPKKAGSVNGSPERSRFRAPTALTVEADGDVLVADSGNHVIRRIIRSTHA
eukprot:CAMPEP_0167745934 /NCGR_PEP_ID=MMETSP0110_2-20121227/3426_1 /TAXON_ID=629695 /ORGANISM="Gymnochlora sp., Strain CCMP2014" /LENGTH=96 /DNA_ID=CAMNT_0007630629 /DNA_START=621 /DNA_END=911 /DNA_ORIENTATION=+